MALFLKTGHNILKLRSKCIFFPRALPHISRARRPGHISGISKNPFGAKINSKCVFFGYELKLLISTAGGRFPRAWLEPRANRMLVMEALRQGVAILAFHPMSHSGVSRLMLFPQESPPSVPINDAVLRIMNKLKHLWN